MHVQTVLEELGYKPHEVQLYLAALTMGEGTTTELSKQAGLPRTTVEGIAEHLQRIGLLNSYKKSREHCWVAANPQKLLIRLEERAAALKSIMPELQGIRYQREIKPTVRVFQNEEEIKHIMDDIIDTRHHIAAIVAWDEWKEFSSKEYLESFIERRCKSFLKIKFLIAKTSAGIALKSRDEKELRHTKFLPSQIEIKNSNYIYGNKVAIISLNKTQPNGIIIEDPDITHTMTVLFDCLWEKSFG